MYGFIPRKNSDALKQAVASYAAAQSTINTKGHPGTPEGMEARRAMETRLEQAKRNRDNLIEELLNASQVYVAGDAEPVGGMLLETKVHAAAVACLDRLYPRFHEADHTDWHKVIDRAKKGDGDALEVVGYKGDPDQHPVCAAILEFVGSGKEGTKVRKQFAGPKFGWPQDAIDAAMMVLHRADKLQARFGGETVAKGKLDQKNITTTEFRVEDKPLSKVELIQLRTLFKAVGLNTTSGQESQSAQDFLNRVKVIGEAAGGDAPLPRRPDLSHVQELAQRVGNDQLKGVLDHRERLTQEVTDWKAVADKIAKRQPRWSQMTALLDHAADLPVAPAVRPEFAAVEQSRGLLTDPDPVPDIVETLTAALRSAVNQAHAACTSAHEVGLASLEASANWQKLSPEQRYDLLSKNGSRVVPAVAVGTTEEILDTLRQTKLSELRAIGDALPTRFGNALAAAAKLLEPKAQHVKLAGGTIKDETDLKSWLKAAEDRIRAGLRDGPVIL